MTQDQSVIILEYADDPLGWTAESLLNRFESRLPDLSKVHIFVEEPTIEPVLRQQLLLSAQQYSCHALLGPNISTLKDFALASPAQLPLIDRASSEIHLKKELEDYTHLFGESDPWRLANSLLDLFSELTYQEINTGNDIDSFIARISDAWHINNTRINQHSDEARIIYTLWNAWQEQLSAFKMQDESTALQQALQFLIDEPPVIDFIYILGATDLKGVEYQYIKHLLTQGNAQLIIQSAPQAKLATINSSIPTHWQRLSSLLDLPTDNANPRQETNPAATDFFNTVFDFQYEALPTRAENFAEQCPVSPVHGKMQCVSANGIEQEAMLVTEQISQWVTQGYRNIGIVSEDRKLSRRVRALLERNEIQVFDLAGWTLATTRVATVIESWLQCIETNFSHHPLLELLKSPYFSLQDTEEFEHAIYRFELDIIHYEQVASGIKRYLKHIDYRQQRLHWDENQTQTIVKILNLFDTIAKPLQQACRNNSDLSADQYISLLLKNLEQLGLIQALTQDDAGTTMLNVLEQLKHCTSEHPQTINWIDFRDWLGQQFENSHFRPQVDSKNIQLLTLAQTRLMSFERLVIAGNEYSLIPGSAATTPYFNQQVRKELGLSSRQDYLSIRLHDYRRLIENTLCREHTNNECKLLFTWRHQDQDEEIMPTPWLQAIQSFHQQAWGVSLVNNDFYQQVLDELRPTAINNADSDLPAYSIANIDQSLIPEYLSVSNHQQLIDCPYKFFCASVLKLQAVEEIQEALSAADYGHKVHACLEAFHTQVSGMPAPFDLPFLHSNRAQAIQHLHDISQTVFSQDLEANFQHRAWLQRWISIIPAYIDWQIGRTGFFKLDQTEQVATRPVGDMTILKGRLDRIDVTLAPVGDGKNLNVIDYKTGSSNLSSKQIAAGEQTQLLCYALLDERIDSVQYLQLTPDKPGKTQAEFKAQELESLKQKNYERLNLMLEQLAQGHDMPAWGSAKACEHCRMSGICRNQITGMAEND